MPEIYSCTNCDCTELFCIYYCLERVLKDLFILPHIKFKSSPTLTLFASVIQPNITFLWLFFLICFMKSNACIPKNIITKSPSPGSEGKRTVVPSKQSNWPTLLEVVTWAKGPSLWWRLPVFQGLFLLYYTDNCSEWQLSTHCAHSTVTLIFQVSGTKCYLGELPWSSCFLFAKIRLLPSRTAEQWKRHEHRSMFESPCGVSLPRPNTVEAVRISPRPVHLRCEQ